MEKQKEYTATDRHQTMRAEYDAYVADARRRNLEEECILTYETWLESELDASRTEVEELDRRELNHPY